MALTKVTGQVVNTSTDLTVGVLTATTASFTGNVSVGGTLTYEDVTNVDSVGLITARNGISVTGSNISVESSEDRLLYLKSTDANAYLTFEDTDSSSGFANRIGSVSDGLYFSTGGGGERARIDSSGRIGIGMVPHTSSTGYALQIDGGASSFIQIFNDTSGNTVNDGFVIGNDANTAYLVNKENTPLVFRTNNTERLRIDSSGNVGIKNTVAATIDAVNNAGTLVVGDGSSAEGITIYTSDSTSGELAFADGTSGSATQRGRIIYAHGDNSMRISTNGSEALRIDSSGNFGLGTTSPSNILSLDDTQASGGVGIDITNQGDGGSSTTPYVFINAKLNPARPGGEIRFGREGVYGSESTADSFMAFYTAVNSTNTERMRIDSSGKMGLGTASPTADGLHIVHSTQPDLFMGTSTNAEGFKIVYSDSSSVIGNVTSTPLRFVTGNSEKARIDSSGRLLISVTSSYANANADDLQVGNNNASAESGISLGSTTASGIRFADAGNASAGVIEYAHASDSMRLYTSGTERVRIDSSGRMGIGTNSPSSLLHLSGNQTALRIQRTSSLGFLYNVGTSSTDATRLQAESGPLDLFTNASQPIIFKINGDNEKVRIHTNGNFAIGTSSPVRDFHNANGVCLTTGSAPQYRLNGGAGDSNDNDRAIFGLATADDHFFSTAVAGDTVLRTTNGGDLLFGEGTTERARLDTDGNFLVGKTELSDVSTGLSMRVGGVVAFEATVASGAGHCMMMNRQGDDGTYVKFRQANTLEGSITVSGSTVSYNGGHLARWSQFVGISTNIKSNRPTILRGSVLSNLDEMCEWGEEDNEQLNRMKVSDVEGDINVSGVFQAWDDNDDTYTNDFYCAMTGDFVIRIASGVTVQRGNLLMSAGDGTAKPQGDGYVQDKTIAKVTSTTVSATYSDGSYCVPCVLMAC